MAPSTVARKYVPIDSFCQISERRGTPNPSRRQAASLFSGGCFMTLWDELDDCAALWYAAALKGAGMDQTWMTEMDAECVRVRNRLDTVPSREVAYFLWHTVHLLQHARLTWRLFQLGSELEVNRVPLPPPSPSNRRPRGA